jgi:small GTP-binding protein
MKILTNDQETVLQRERNFLNDLRLKLVEFNASRDDINSLGHSIRQLDDLFLLVVVGEFNAGKSAFINALMGEKMLKEGVTPTTSQITILRYGETSEPSLVEEGHTLLLFPVDLLSELSIVDTPGTNAVIRQHEELTTHFIPRADLVLFVTSADRPFTESERSFMEHIRDWGKKVVIILNKTDLLQDEEELAQVLQFVKENAQILLGSTPEIFTVSARLALRAKTGEPQFWQDSGFEAMENYIYKSLDQTEQIRLKFLNPLGVGTHLTGKYYERAENQRKILEEDISLLQNVERQQAVYKADMQKDFTFRMADVENIFYEMEQRGDEFFEDRFRLVKVFDLLKKERMQDDFTHEVIADLPQQVETKVNALIDWLVESDLQQWKAVTSYLADRQREHKDNLIGEGIDTNFTYDRNRLLDAIGGEAEHVVKSYDKRAEASAIAENAKNAVAASAAVEVGAIGLGTLVTVLASTMAVDVTGILAASVVAALGFFIIPAKRRKAKTELHEKLVDLRTELVDSLKVEFEKEIDHSLERIEEAITPYTRFIRSETAHTEKVQEELKAAQLEINQIRAQVESW